MSIRYTDPRTEMVQYVPRGAKSVLDVGCSSGEFGRALRSSVDLDLLVGLEPNRAAVQLAEEIYDLVFPHPLEAAPDELLGMRFDVAVFNDVLEHMADPGQALAAVRPLLNEGGVVVASIPNVRHLSVTGPLVVLGRFDYSDSGILDTTHLRFFTAASIRELFAAAGFTVLQFAGINRCLRVGESWTRKWIRWLGVVTRGRSDGFFFVQYVVVAAPSR